MSPALDSERFLSQEKLFPYSKINEIDINIDFNILPVQFSYSKSDFILCEVKSDW
jgi:hypothetical protein